MLRKSIQNESDFSSGSAVKVAAIATVSLFPAGVGALLSDLESDTSEADITLFLSFDQRMKY
jgi:hypothetical protein